MKRGFLFHSSSISEADNARKKKVDVAAESTRQNRNLQFEPARVPLLTGKRGTGSMMHL